MLHFSNFFDSSHFSHFFSVKFPVFSQISHFSHFLHFSVLFAKIVDLFSQFFLDKVVGSLLDHAGEAGVRREPRSQLPSDLFVSFFGVFWRVLVTFFRQKSRIWRILRFFGKNS